MIEDGESGRTAMSVTLGVSYSMRNWKTCLVENGQVVEFHSFVDPVALRTYLEHTCTLYPEPIIVVSTDLETPFTSLVNISRTCLEDMILKRYIAEQKDPLLEILIAIGYSNINSYFAPSVRYLPSMPQYRLLMRESPGTSNHVCAVASLLSQLRSQEATWSEMNFLCLEVNANLRSILVVEGGQIVNGMSSMTRSEAQFQEACEQAFWEGLTQDLAGLMAIHHLEDIVVSGQRKDAFIERFADSYQVYHFPYIQPDFEGFEAASGAAAIAEGLFGHSIFTEIVERLQIREANGGLKDEAGIVPVKDTMPDNNAVGDFSSVTNM
ncbi:MAG TPA: DUF1464 family protein [Ktedonobacteraceae bacterium]